MKKNKFILIAPLLFLFVVLLLIFNKKKTNISENQSVSNTSENNKTESLSELRVVSITPKDGSVFVNEKSEISVTFNRAISQIEKDRIRVLLTPKEDLDVTFESNNMKVVHTNSLKLNTKYSLKINLGEKLLYLTNFETNPFTEEQIKTEGSLQTQGDLDFTTAWFDVLKKYPWYRRLPIEKDDYAIVFDFDIESFRIIFIKKDLDENSKKKIIDTALNDLKIIGVQEPIKYITEQI